MKTLVTIITSIFFGTTLFAGETAHDDHHIMHKQKNEGPDKKSGNKFTADTILKTHMAAILETLKMLEKDSSKNRKNIQKKASTQLEGTIQDIFKNCKLTSEADAAIHPILANILEAAKLIGDGKENEGREIIHKALLNYKDFFDDSGLKYERNE